MKRTIALAAGALCLCGAAFAEPTVQVQIPADLTNSEEVAAYKASLDSAVKEVCRRASSPIIGTNYYRYLACLKDTRDAVIHQDPTGIYAEARGVKTSIAVATR